MPENPSAAVAIIRARTPRDAVLLLRRNHNPHDPWSGHFSLPGGRRDPQDTNLLMTCTRETYEETGITLSHHCMCGELPPRYAGSRVNATILVKPYLFEIDRRPPLTLNDREIAGACWLEIRRFLQREHHVKAEVLPNRIAPAYPIDDYYLWGFTYGLITQLLGMPPEM